MAARTLVRLAFSWCARPENVTTIMALAAFHGSVATSGAGERIQHRAMTNHREPRLSQGIGYSLMVGCAVLHALGAVLLAEDQVSMPWIFASFLVPLVIIVGIAILMVPTGVFEAEQYYAWNVDAMPTLVTRNHKDRRAKARGALFATAFFSVFVLFGSVMAFTAVFVVFSFDDIDDGMVVGVLVMFALGLGMAASFAYQLRTELDPVSWTRD